MLGDVHHDAVNGIIAAIVPRKRAAQQQGQPPAVLVPQTQLQHSGQGAVMFFGNHVEQFLGVFGVQQIYEVGGSRVVGIVPQQLPKAVVGVKNAQRQLGRNADNPAVDVVGNVGKTLVAGQLAVHVFAAQVQGVGDQRGDKKHEFGNDNEQRAVLVYQVRHGGGRYGCREVAGNDLGSALFVNGQQQVVQYPLQDIRKIGSDDQADFLKVGIACDGVKITEAGRVHEAVGHHGTTQNRVGLATPGSRHAVLFVGKDAHGGLGKNTGGVACGIVKRCRYRHPEKGRGGYLCFGFGKKVEVGARQRGCQSQRLARRRVRSGKGVEHQVEFVVGKNISGTGNRSVMGLKDKLQAAAGGSVPQNVGQNAPGIAGCGVLPRKGLAIGGIPHAQGVALGNVGKLGARQRRLVHARQVLTPQPVFQVGLLHFELHQGLLQLLHKLGVLGQGYVVKRRKFAFRKDFFATLQREHAFEQRVHLTLSHRRSRLVPAGVLRY